MNEPFLSIRGVSKRFGKTEALRGIDLDVMGDEMLVVLGPTGAGKTTLLRVIAGLENPDAGELMLSRKRVNDVSSADRDVAIVFQNFFPLSGSNGAAEHGVPTSGAGTKSL